MGNKKNSSSLKFFSFKFFKSYFLIVGFVSIGLFEIAYADHVDWKVIRTDSGTGNQITSRYSARMVNDSGRNKVIMFGGSTNTGTRYNDTWEWNGSTWTKITTSGSITARNFHAMAYDASNTKTVLFGGQTSGGKQGDTWLYTGSSSTWSSSSPAHAPSARTYHAMAYDASNSKVVLFGGSDSGGTYKGDTWTWDGSDWTNASNSGPSARVNHMMAYDSARGKVVLFGGTNNSGTKLNDTWEWNGSSWTQISVTGPTARESGSMTFDSASSKIILYGGYSGSAFLEDTYAYDGSTWTSWASITPYSRNHAGIAYDANNSQIVMFGGYYDYGASDDCYSDTWTAGAAVAPSIITGSSDTELLTMDKNTTSCVSDSNVHYSPATQGLATDGTKLYMGYENDSSNVEQYCTGGRIDIVSEYDDGILLGSRNTPSGLSHTNDMKWESSGKNILATQFCPVGASCWTSNFKAWRIDARDGHTSTALPTTPTTAASNTLQFIALDGSQPWRGISTVPSSGVVSVSFSSFDGSGNIITTYTGSNISAPIQGSFIKGGFLWLVSGDSSFTFEKYSMEQPLRLVGSWTGNPPSGGNEPEGLALYRDRIVYSAYQTNTANKVISLRSDLSNKVIDDGDPVSFYCAATGTPPLTFAWKLNGNTLSDGGVVRGATTNSLTIDGMDVSHEGTYQCVVTNDAGTANSSTFTLDEP